MQTQSAFISFYAFKYILFAKNRKFLKLDTNKFNLLLYRFRKRQLPLRYAPPDCCGTSPPNKMENISVLPEHVCKITRKSIRHSQKLLQNLRTILNKKKHQIVTRKELADYLGIDEEWIDLR